ncbi:7-cyano-7-deazaguanine synthase QueC [Culturomica massiliensis]|uniref:7-cyano-7-deazaguanine synthase QueC n=1 Tax=Culturomica massiliensis TaxID=1841857 RepID=UPI002597380D|nr:7-cyano-7-deazaguanine synthase QueC [Culturomica massiliensis]
MQRQTRKNMKKAIVLLSGGLDSSTALYVAKKEGFDELYALTFEYGQKHDREIRSASAIAKAVGVREHKIVRLMLNAWKGSSLTDPDVVIQDGDADRTDIPDTYVPARNMVFLSVAASYADALDITDIFIGVSEMDYSGYVDCREEFIRSMEQTINLGTVLGAEKKQKITIHAPFLRMTKADEVKLGTKLGVDFSLTWSCYRGGEKPCGTCDSCLLRARAFAEAGIADPLV